MACFRRDGKTRTMRTLFVSIDAWNKCNEYLRAAKEATDIESSQTLQWIAARWRAKHEMLQALYFSEIKP